MTNDKMGKRSSRKSKSSPQKSPPSVDVAFSHCPHVKACKVYDSLSELAKSLKPPCSLCVSAKNRWLCLTCDRTFCGAKAEGHTTAHHSLNSSHHVHLNVTTLRLWCHTCAVEVQPCANIPGWACGERLLSEEMIKRLKLMLKAGDDEPTSSAAYAVLDDEPSTVLRNRKTPSTYSNPAVHQSPPVSPAPPPTFLAEDTTPHSPSTVGRPLIERSKSLLTFNSVVDDEQDCRERDVMGLYNLGNTCYMNAALQCLLHCTPLTAFFDSAPRRRLEMSDGETEPCMGDYSAVSAYTKLVANFSHAHKMFENERHVYSPRSVLQSVQRTHPSFRGCFLDTLHNDTRQVVYAYEQRMHHAYRQLDCQAAVDTVVQSPSPVSVSRQSSTNSGETTFTTADEEESIDNDDPIDADFAADGGVVEEPVSDVAVGSNAQGHNSPKQKPIRLIPLTDVMQRTYGTSSSCTYRSCVTDVFDGRILSSVRCRTCQHVSHTYETFQDLSLAIPTQEQLNSIQMLDEQQQNDMPLSRSTSQTSLYVDAEQSPPLSRSTSDTGLFSSSSVDRSWLTWMSTSYSSWSNWLSSSLIGSFSSARVELKDCLRAFFTPDELRGDNMYNCEKCAKLRDGVKECRIVQLPEVLCIHLKRFRHEASYSSKVSTAVSFPTDDMCMSSYVHPSKCTSHILSYDLVGIVTHMGSADGGHYVAYCRDIYNDVNRQWFEYDDSNVTPVSDAYVFTREAYVLFYAKQDTHVDAVKQRIRQITHDAQLNAARRSNRNTRATRAHHGVAAGGQTPMLTYCVSTLWLQRLVTFGEPGPITNHDFLCPHARIAPHRAPTIDQYYERVDAETWKYIYDEYGGGPVCCNELTYCLQCNNTWRSIQLKRDTESLAYDLLRKARQKLLYDRIAAADPSTPMVEPPRFVINATWMRQWDAFISQASTIPPGPINNQSLLRAHHGDMYLRRNGDTYADYKEIVDMFMMAYGGGPMPILGGEQLPEGEREDSGEEED